MENIIFKLNEMLFEDSFDRQQFESLINTLKAQLNLTLVFEDFEFYNEKRLENTQKEKRAGIESLNYDWALMQRKIENYCIEKLELKAQYKIDRSSFYQEENLLFYFYLGTSKNDKLAKEYFFNLSRSFSEHDFTPLARI
jgi:hypothetical protein